MSDQVLSCDVAVVGGGPAGSTCAGLLASRGRDVVLLERFAMPRAKPCAGGLSAAALGALPGEVSSVLEREFHMLRVVSLDGRQVEWSSTRPFMFTAYREQLDWLLWQRASASGARTIDARAVSSVERDVRGVVMSGTGFTLRAKYVVGADGASSIVRRALGFGKARHVAAGMVADVPVASCGARSGEPVVELLVGLGRGVYGWVFPFRETLSVGVEWHYPSARRNQAFRKVLGRVDVDPVRVRPYSHAIPSIPSDGRVAHGGALLIGDAAGMCDPLTGEGVRNAVVAGTVAADVLDEALSSADGRLDAYQAWFEREMLVELKAAMRFLRVATRLEGAGLLVLERQERARRAAMALLRGDLTYSGILNALKPGGGLLKALFEVAS